MISRSRTAVVLAATFAIGAGVAAAPYAGSTSAAGAAVTAQNPNGKLLGVIPSHPTAPSAAHPAAAAPDVVNPVTYHNGPVQHSSTVYSIFWAPAGVPFPTNYPATIIRYFTDVAHDSFTAANPYGSDTQYYDITSGVKRFESYAVTTTPVISDTNAYPANGCNNFKIGDGTTSKKCLTNTQIVNQIKAVIAAHHLPTGMATEYFLFTPRGVASCLAANSLGSGNCYDPLNFPGYCAYHSHSGTGAQAVLFANMHFANIAGCASGQSPENNPADSTINGISHEHQETMTDPLGTAWYDVDGNEIADKCEFNFGDPTGTNAFGEFNQVINGHDYWLQQIWSNRDLACVQRNTFAQPTASFTYTPAAPTHGKPVTFHSTSVSGDGTALKYAWTFANGTTSAVANPVTTFGVAGVKPVTLIVTDTSGDQSRTTQNITVH